MDYEKLRALVRASRNKGNKFTAFLSGRNVFAIDANADVMIGFIRDWAEIRNDNGVRVATAPDTCLSSLIIRASRAGLSPNSIDLDANHES